jgi:hypothetical protein
MPRLLEGRLESFYADGVEEFRMAGARAGLVEHTLRFGDRRVGLRFAGAALADALIGPFARRLDVPGGALDARIDLWAAGEYRVPWAITDIGPAGLVRGSDRGGVVVVHETGSGAVTLVDVGARAIQYRVRSAQDVPWWERAAPLRTALFWALSGEDEHLVHSGAVGDERGGLLLAGASGSGKTTVALASLVHGLGYLSDDYVLLRSTPTEILAHAVYDTAKLDQGHLRRFPSLAAQVRHPPPREASEKAVLDVAELMPETIRDSLLVRGVVVPRIRGGVTGVRPLGGAEALLALGPSTVLQTPFDDVGVLRSLADLARRLPCFALDVGQEVAAAARAVDRILAEVTP